VITPALLLVAFFLAGVAAAFAYYWTEGRMHGGFALVATIAATATFIAWGGIHIERVNDDCRARGGVPFQSRNGERLCIRAEALL
jgi:hypothetical protein